MSKSYNFQYGFNMPEEVSAKLDALADRFAGGNRSLVVRKLIDEAHARAEPIEPEPSTRELVLSVLARLTEIQRQVDVLAHSTRKHPRLKRKPMGTLPAAVVEQLRVWSESRREFTTGDALRHLGEDVEDRAQQQRVGQALRALGFVRRRLRRKGSSFDRTYVYTRHSLPPP